MRLLLHQIDFPTAPFFLLGAVRRPSQGFASVFCYYYLCFLCSKFPELCSVTKPKLGLSLGTKSENLLHHIFSLAFEWSLVELEDIDQERLDNIDVFWLFFFLFIWEGGGSLGARAPPHLGKKFCSEMSKRGEKVSPRYIGKKECTRSAQIPQN